MAALRLVDPGFVLNPAPGFFVDLKDRTLTVTRSGCGEEVPDGIDRLAVLANDPADVALPELQLEDNFSGGLDFRQHHLVRKINKLAYDKLQKFFHGIASMNRAEPE